MLTARQNLIETIRGGKPDRFVNQYEGIVLLDHPYTKRNNGCPKGGKDVINAWGVNYCWPEGHPGAYPVHTPETIVVKDIEEWQDYVNPPSLKFTDEEWDFYKQQYDAIDRSKAFAAAFVAPGFFEQCHHLCSMPEALMNFIANPDEMKDMIRRFVDWELELAEGICSHLHPDALFHHDDWGSERSTFLSPDMFAEFFVEPYKEVYKYYHEHGVELVFHHSDSYAATLVPHMIEMGIDVWQGVMDSNDIATLLPKYGGQIAFMGGIDNKFIDHEGWTDDECDKIIASVCEKYGEEYGGKYFIPCITQGGPGSCVPGAYEGLFKAMDRYNAKRFGLSGFEKERVPMQVIF